MCSQNVKCCELAPGARTILGSWQEEGEGEEEEDLEDQLTQSPRCCDGGREAAEKVSNSSPPPHSQQLKELSHVTT